MRKVFLVAGMAVLAACSTPRPAPKITPVEQARLDHGAVSKLVPDFESRLSIRRNVEVSVYLRRMGRKIIASSPELSELPISVLVIQDNSDRWRSFALPGNKVYLSSGLIKGLEFENQLAAEIAFQLAHITLRHAVTRLARHPIDGGQSTPGVSSAEPDYFGPDGIFAFDSEQLSRSAEVAVKLMYQAGFDPRGLVSLLDLFEVQPAHCPYELAVIERIKTKARQAIALYAPLRNPIVRSTAFLSIQERIRQL